jgi:uncharacterized protein YidB (DUF937 family)
LTVVCNRLKEILVKSKLVAGAVAGLAVAGGGAAIAATQFNDPKAESQAIVTDAAQQLGVAPEKLTAALKKALENRVDAEVAAGRITKAQGDELKQRIEAGDVPLVGGPGRGGHGFGHHGFFGLDAAATFLGLTEDQLHTQLDSGKTLAQLAQAKGKSADDLVAALVADAKTHLDAAVAAGRLTQAQETTMLADVKQRITDFVNGKAPSRQGFRRGGLDGGPPPFAGPDA